jgi:Gram-negative bacterial TonB protein C-terminal
MPFKDYIYLFNNFVSLKLILMKTTLTLFFILILSQFIYSQAPIGVTQKPPIEFNNVDVRPQFKGGIQGFLNFIAKNYQAPEEDGSTGVLLMSFEINELGKITNIKIVKEVGKGAGSEAVRVLKNCPDWTPGLQDGKPVSVLYSFPINLNN